jgi:hypothetical protein
MKVKVLGELSPDPLAEIPALGDSPFMRFNAVDIGVQGLAVVDGSTVDILAVWSHRRGSFRRLIKDLQRHYKTIGVWAINNSLIDESLVRYGFKPDVATFIDDDQVTGMRWTANS